MEDRIRSITSWVKTFVVTVFVITSNHVYFWLTAEKQFGAALSTCVLIVGALLIVQLSEATVTYLIGQSAHLRRLMFGRYFVEGHWFDAVISTSDNTVREYGLIEVSVENNKVKIDGILYDINYRRIGSFTSTISQFDGRAIQYGYTRRVVHDHTIEEACGIGEYVFPRECPYPLSFSGWFFDSALDKKVQVQAIRIMDDSVLDLINSRESADSKEAVQKLADLFLNEYPEYRALLKDAYVPKILNAKRDLQA